MEKNISIKYGLAVCLAISTLLTLPLVFLTSKTILLLPVVLMGIWLWVRVCIKFPIHSLLFILFFAESGFGIFSFGIPPRLHSDIAILLLFPVIVFRFDRVWEYLFTRRSWYGIAIFIFFIVIYIALYFGSYMTYGQPITIGLVVARKYLLIFSYFFLIATAADREDCFLFLKYLAWIGAAISCLAIVDAVLGGGVIFKYLHGAAQERGGNVRVAIGTFLIVYACIYSFIKLQYLRGSSNARLGYTIILFIGLTALISVNMTRAAWLGMTAVFLFWMLRKITLRRVIFACFTVSIVILTMLSGAGDMLLTDTYLGKIAEKTAGELADDGGNIKIRKDVARYSLELTLENAPITGIGFFSDSKYPNNPLTQGAVRYGYFLSDANGLSTIVYFGLQGLILLVFLNIRALYDVLKAIKYAHRSTRYQYEVLFYILLYTLATPTLNNILTQGMLIYTGIFFYLLSITHDSSSNQSVKA